MCENLSALQVQVSDVTAVVSTAAAMLHNSGEPGSRSQSNEDLKCMLLAAQMCMAAGRYII